MQDTTHLIKDLIHEHNADVITEGIITHNQRRKTQLISLYRNSLYEDAPGEDEGVVFFNVVNKNVDVANKKMDIDEKHHKLFINDEFYNFTMNAAYTEYKDDTYYGEFVDDLTMDYNVYGTVVTKVQHLGYKKSVREHIPWTQVICNPNSWEASPQAFIKEVRLHKILNNPLYLTDDLKVELKDEFSMPTVQAFELHGTLSKFYRTGNDDDKAVQETQQHLYVHVPPEHLKGQIVKEYPEGKFYTISIEKTKQNPLDIKRRIKVTNRTMGRGIVEEGIDAQMVTNEVANLMIEQLRAAAKVVRYTDDEELDGMTFDEVDNDTLINVSRGRTIGQIQSNTVAFGEMQNYIQMYAQQNQDESAVQDVALGKQQFARTPHKTTQAQGEEVNSAHLQYREQLVKHINYLHKKKGGIIDMCIDYIETKKAITDLLHGDMLENFYMFTADRLVESDNVERVLARKPVSEDRQARVEEVAAKLAGQEFNVMELSGVKWDRDMLRDKIRVRIDGQQKDVDAEIATLQALYAQVVQNPASFPHIKQEDLLKRIVSLSDSDSVVTLFRKTQAVTPQEAQQQGPANVVPAT